MFLATQTSRDWLEKGYSLSQTGSQSGMNGVWFRTFSACRAAHLTTVQMLSWISDLFLASWVWIWNFFTVSKEKWSFSLFLVAPFLQRAESADIEGYWFKHAGGLPFLCWGTVRLITLWNKASKFQTPEENYFPHASIFFSALTSAPFLLLL